MVILVLLIQNFPGILHMTEFHATEFHKRIISWVHRHPNTHTNKHKHGSFIDRGANGGLA